MAKSNNALEGALATLCVIGVVLGPASWYLSHSFYSELHALVAGGKKAVATVDRTHDLIGYKHSLHTADVHFRDPEDDRLVQVEGVEINALYENELRAADEVDVWYLDERAVIVDNYKPEYVPLIKKPYWGMILTILSFGLFVRMVVIVQRKRRESNQES